MSDTPPVIGADPWGEALNSYLISLESRIIDLEGQTEHIYNSFSWQFSNAAPPATGSQLRLNNVNATQATLIDLRKIDNDGADRSAWLKLLDFGAVIRIHDWDNAAVFHRFTVTAPPTFDATNAQIPVVWDTGNGVLPNAKVSVAMLVTLTI